MPVAPGLAPYDTFLLDLDGCVWVGDEPTPNAVEAVGALRAAGRRLAFVTNDARHGEEDFVRKLWRLGFQAAREEIVTAGGALQHVLAESGRATAFVIGSAAVHRHVTDAGLRILNGSDLADRAEVVVVSGHERFDFAELRGRGAGRAARRRGVVHEPRRDLPDARRPLAGHRRRRRRRRVRHRRAGALGGQARAPALPHRPRPPGRGRALVIGDRLDADMAGARAAGLDGALVLTGASTAAMARDADPAPAFVAATLAELLLAP